jgi:hypothetical protein
MDSNAKKKLDTDGSAAEFNSTSENLSAEQRAEEILAAARAEAEKIRTQAREEAAATSRSSRRSPILMATDQVMAKARAAVAEITSKAASATGQVPEKVAAKAESLMSHVREAVARFKEEGPKTAAEALVWAKGVEEDILGKARETLEEVRTARSRDAGNAITTVPQGRARSGRVSSMLARDPVRNRRDVLMLSGGMAAALLGTKLLNMKQSGSFGEGGLMSGRGGSGGSAPTQVDVSSLKGATSVGGARDIGLGILGDYIYLCPTKLGGGTHAQDLLTGHTLAWIEYWNYGDSCPISHHLSAYPSPDPRKGFEFVNSTQGGDNVLIYGLPTDIKSYGLLDPVWGQGNRIYRVHYDGQQMNLLEDVSETTGIGLGVHCVIYPDATGFASADGQKDVCAFFDRPPLPDLNKDDKPVSEHNRGKRTQVLMAYRADWIGKEPNGSLEQNWFGGGKLRVTRLVKAKETGLYDYRGTKGNKIEWEMVPMGENLVYTGQLPGASPKTLCGLDAVVHHPGNRYSSMIIRMCSASVIVDRKTWEPVTCLHNPEGSPGNLPVKKVGTDPDIWEIEFPDIKCVGHEAGFSPDGKFYTMMNNIRQNNMAVFDTSDADPRNWKKITFVKDDKWVGDYPSPFHLCFSMDKTKMFVSVLYPKPAKSSTVVVDTSTWKIIKKFENIGPDCQTMAVTYDGKYVFQIFSGFQRLDSGVFVFTQDTLEPVGLMPNFGGHHDCVVVPTKVEQLVNSRCTTL